MESALTVMDGLGTDNAILSVSVPGTTFLPGPAEAAALARALDTLSAD